MSSESASSEQEPPSEQDDLIAHDDSATHDESVAHDHPTSHDDSFVERVLSVVEAIPSGRVMTYGDVAAVFGSRGARVVGQVMARYGSDVPWWRVIRSSGHPPIGHEDRALERYRAEGTPLADTAPDAAYRVNLRAARWWPDS